MCNHRTCAEITSKGGRGVATVIYLNHTQHGLVFGLGKERGGQYANQYSVCAGSMDPQDGCCYITTSMRELKEELGITLTLSQFDQHFRNKFGKIRYFMIRKTAVFLGRFDGLSRATIKRNITNHNQFYQLPPCFHEISDYEIFRADGTHPEATVTGNRVVTYYPVSSFALECLRMASGRVDLW